MADRAELRVDSRSNWMHTTWEHLSKHILNPQLILIYALATLILVGTVILILPISSKEGFVTPFVEALFTATSAATVTGLVVFDTPTYWSPVGKLVIMALMFTGGLGIMTVVASLFILVRHHVSLSQRLIMRETIGTSVLADVSQITLRIVLWAVGIQFFGFVLLAFKFSLDYEFPQALWHALFQSISGFNNAGFTSISGSTNLSAFVSDKFVLCTIAVLMLLGSMSYWVMLDMARKRRFATLALNTKLVLVFTMGLILLGAGVFFIGEYRNSQTIGGISFTDQIVNSVFHSISRTAGFSTVDFNQTGDQTNLVYIVLMFVGGASASVAGGIKVNTLALILIATAASLRGSTGASMFGRKVPDIQIQWAVLLTIIMFFGAFLLCTLLVTFEQDYLFMDLLFEAISAFGTVGLSTGITGDLSTSSHLLLIVGMFVGRLVPPMFIVVALSRRDSFSAFRYPNESVMIG